MRDHDAGMLTLWQYAAQPHRSRFYNIAACVSVFHWIPAPASAGLPSRKRGNGKPVRAQTQMRL